MPRRAVGLRFIGRNRTPEGRSDRKFTGDTTRTLRVMASDFDDDFDHEFDDDIMRPRHTRAVRWTAILVVASFVAAGLSAVLVNL